jgi:hypothetical protein
MIPVKSRSENEVLAIVVVLVLVLGFFGDFEDENEESAVIAEFSDRL